MSVANCSVSGVEDADGIKVPAEQRPLHRIGSVRRVQGVTRRAVARQLDIDVSQVKLQERETCDLSLSMLYEWQKVLDVPIAELLVEANDPLSPPVLKRAQLVRLMKTVLAVMEECDQQRVRRMAQTMVDQLIDIMPELEGVTAWHAVGKRRRRDDLGVAAQRRLSEDVFMDLVE